jgi:hypothetical protein
VIRLIAQAQDLNIAVPSSDRSLDLYDVKRSGERKTPVYPRFFSFRC